VQGQIRAIFKTKIAFLRVLALKERLLQRKEGSGSNEVHVCSIQLIYKSIVIVLLMDWNTRR
jgi:hypothetical protein